MWTSNVAAGRTTDPAATFRVVALNARVPHASTAESASVMVSASKMRGGASTTGGTQSDDLSNPTFMTVLPAAVKLDGTPSARTPASASTDADTTAPDNDTAWTASETMSGCRCVTANTGSKPWLCSCTTVMLVDTSRVTTAPGDPARHWA